MRIFYWLFGFLSLAVRVQASIFSSALSLSSDASGKVLGIVSHDHMLYISHDNGQSWKNSTIPCSDCSKWQFIGSNQDSSLMAVSGPGNSIFLSSDVGLSWVASSAPYKNWNSIVIANHNKLLVATASGDGLFLSFDSGMSWAKADIAHLTWLKVVASEDTKTLVTIAQEGNIFFSTDHGATWRESIIERNSWMDVCVDSSGNQIVLVSVEGSIVKSSNGGGSWNKVFQIEHGWRGISCDYAGKHLVASSIMDGLYYSDNFGVTWHIADAPKNHFALVVSNDVGNQFIAAAEDANDLFKSLDGGRSWKKLDKDKSSSIAEMSDWNWNNLMVKLLQEASASIPTFEPTAEPTTEPSAHPTLIPTEVPTAEPTTEPSTEPTIEPTAEPTKSPSNVPTVVPTAEPTISPSNVPTVVPTAAPTMSPSYVPTVVPTAEPTAEPTKSPSNVPTVVPTAEPTKSPSYVPTVLPTAVPTIKPTYEYSQLPSSYPSSQPTSQPTSLPTMILFPEYDVTVPTIMKNSALFTVNFHTISGYAGIVYCAANSTPYDDIASNLKKSLFYSAYTVGDKSVDVRVNSLTPFTDYSGYCLLYNLQKAQSSPQEKLLANKVFFSTLCCKSVFATFPSFLLPNTTALISYRLSDLPKKNIKIIPKFSHNNTVRVFPAFQMISGNSDANLIGSFSITVLTAGIPSVFVSLEISGDSSKEFPTKLNNSIPIVDIAKLPPPKLSAAQFSDSGAVISITFDSAANISQFGTSPWQCDQIFFFPGANNTSCYWLNSVSIQVSLPTTSNLVTGQSITLLAEKLQAACRAKDCSSYDFSQKHSTQLLAPTNPITPVIILSVPSTISGCSDIVINPTATVGNAGRKWTSVTWKISGPSKANVTAIQKYFDTVTGTAKSFNLFRSQFDKLGFVEGDYSLQLRVENFLGGFASGVVTFSVTENMNVPSLSILSPSAISIKASDSLSLLSKVSLPLCTSPTASLKYTWTVCRQNEKNCVPKDLNSKSKNPALFELSPNSLQSGNIYKIELNVEIPGGASSSFVTVNVLDGLVLARISGGNIRQISNYTLLDASLSTDQNSGNSSGLNFFWTCKLTSILRYGESCDSVFNTPRDSTKLLVRKSMLSAGEKYSFEVLATSKNGRFSRASVEVSLVKEASGSNNNNETIPSSSISITTDLYRINQGTTAVLNALITSKSDVRAKWSASVGSMDFSLGSLVTSTQREFAAAISATGIAFPLLVAGSNFPASSTISFRLTTYYGSKVSSYSEISISINGPPTNGIFGVSLQNEDYDQGAVNGTALVSVFSFQGIDWVDDAESLPLSYDFGYQLDSSSSLLIIQRKSVDNSAESKLPAGLVSRNYAIDVKMNVYDVFKASTTETVAIRNVPSTNMAVKSTYLAKALSEFSKSNDTTKLLMSTNAVATEYNVVDCSLVPNTFCESINRRYCSNVPQTCGPCLPDFNGVFGPSNVPCMKLAASSLSGTCTNNANCTYGLCHNNECKIPSKSCPGDSGNTTCSGNGDCSFTNGNKVISRAECLVNNPFCKGTCSCKQGYGGVDCSIDSSELAQRSENRVLMCDALLNVLQTADESPELVESLAASLFEVYSSSEVSVSGKEKCLATLNALLEFGKKGLLTSVAAMKLTGIISNFVSPGHSSSLGNSTDSLVTGMMSTLVGGQQPESFTSDSLRLTFERELAYGISNYTISAPQTEEEKHYNITTAKLQFIDDAVKHCDSGDGYMAISVGSWSNNPFSNSFDSVLSRTQSFQVEGTTTESIFSNANNLFRNLNGQQVSSSPAYYLTYPFFQAQNFGTFNHSNSRTNVTFPQCLNYIDGQTYNCSDCSVTSYTSSTVTFVCTDISKICATARSVSASSSLNDMPEAEWENLRSLYSEFDEVPQRSRRLASTSSFKGDTTSQSGAAVMNQLVTLKNDISASSFSTDLNTSKGVIAFIATVLFVMLLGMLFFYRWDREDKKRRIYSTVLYGKSKRGSSSMAAKSKGAESGGEDIPTAVAVTDNDLIMEILDLAIPYSIFSGFFNWQELFQKFLVLLGGYEMVSKWFGKRATSENRISRWIGIFGNMLVLLFLSSVFLGVYFNDDGSCEKHTTEDSCLTRRNGAVSQSLCKWELVTDSIVQDTMHQTSTCSLNPPPTDILFVLASATITLLIAIPIITILEYLRVEIVNKRPDIEQIGISSHSFLGYVPSTGNSLQTSLDYHREIAAKILFGHKHSSASLNSFTKWHADFLSQMKFYDIASIASELQYVIDSVNVYFRNPSHCGVLAGYDADYVGTHEAKKLAIRNELSMNVDKSFLHKSCGDFNPISCLKSLFTSNDGASFIERKISVARNRSDSIVSKLQRINVVDINDVDVKLIQEFVLEQLPPIQRFALRYHIYELPFHSYEKVNPYLWFICNISLIVIYAFFFAWTLYWGISTGAAPLAAWGKNVAIAFAQDIFLIQIVQSYLVYVLSIKFVRPQLQSIYKALKQAALRMKATEEEVEDSGKYSKGDDRLTKDIRVIQHISPACRAARSDQLSVLTSAKLLQFLDDSDMYACRRNTPYSATFATTASTLAHYAFQLLCYLIFGVPAHMSDGRNLIADMYIAAWLPSVVSGTILALYFIYEASWVAFTVICVLFGTMFLVTGFAGLSITHRASRFCCGLMGKYTKFIVHAYNFLRVSLPGRWMSKVIQLMTGSASATKLRNSQQNAIWTVMNSPSLIHARANSEQEIKSAVFSKALCTTPYQTEGIELNKRLSANFAVDKRKSVIDLRKSFKNNAYDISAMHSTERDQEVNRELVAYESNYALSVGSSSGSGGVSSGSNFLDRQSLRERLVTSMRISGKPIVESALSDDSEITKSRYFQYSVHHHTSESGTDALIRSLKSVLGDNYPSLTNVLMTVHDYLSTSPVQSFTAGTTSNNSINDETPDPFVETAEQHQIWKAYHGWALSLSQLEQIVVKTCQVYAPQNIPLAVAEQAEILEEFRAWYSRLSILYGRVPVNRFLLWMIQMMDKIDRCRRARSIVEMESIQLEVPAATRD